MSAREAEILANFPLLLYPAFPCKNIEEIILTTQPVSSVHFNSTNVYLLITFPVQIMTC